MKKNSRKEWMLRILSFVFAVLLWAYVRNESNVFETKTLRNIEVTYEGMDDLRDSGYIVISPKEAKINVTVEAYSNTMPYARDSISAKINLTDYKDGEFSLPITVSSIQSDVKVKRFDPATIPFKIDKRSSQIFYANLSVLGKPANNYSLGDIKDSERVTISGASTYVSKIEKVEAKIDVSNLKKTDYVKADIKAYDSEGLEIDNLNIEPSTIQVQVPILKSKTVPIKLNIVGNIPKDVKIDKFFVEPETVTIIGNSDLIDSIQVINSKEMTLDQIRKGPVPLLLDMPKNVSMVDPKLTFKVVDGENQLIVNNKSLTLKKENIKLLNVNEKFSYEILLNSDIILKYSGQTDNDLTAEDININVDLSNGVSSGEFPINVNLPTGFELTSLNPESVQINIKEKNNREDI